jgi:hypothetical protein
VFKVECCIDFGDRIGGYAVPVATASGSVLSKIQYRRFLRAGHVFSCSLEFQVPTGVVISQNPAFRGSYTRDQSRWTSDEIEYVMLNKFIGLKTAVNNRVLL